MSSSENALKKGAILHSPRRDYVVDSVLGVGGFGITYKVSAKIKVENIYVKNQFAIKEHFLSDACERDHATGMVSISAPSRHKVEQSKIDFLAEANRLNGIKHPNIVAVNEVFEANDTAYYVMEYIDGKSLRHYIENNGVLDERQALAVMTPILNAVNYLHANRLTHLDIKPDNIMMRLDEESGELVPVLIDFGLSKHYDEKGRPTSTIRIQGCSNGYAPIEQYQGINSFSPTADVYALGATLYFLLKGKDPIISGELSREILERELPASLSDATRGALIHAMNLIKAERTQSVAQFATELGVKIDNTATSVSAATLTQPIEKPKLKKPDNSTEIINPNKPSSKRWLAPLLIGLGVLAFFAFNAISGGDDPIAPTVLNDPKDLKDSANAVQPVEVPPPPVSPPVDVVDENVDDGYSVAYAGALNLYNSRKYADCKRECQKLLRQYTSREQKEQLTQLIEYCDTALDAEEEAALERQYQSDYSSAERLYNQKKYSDCKSRCQSMLSSYPSHRGEINALIAKCDSALSAQQASEQASASSHLPDKAVDLGLSVLWADRNVGASSSSGNGNYYTFDEAGSAARSMGSGWRLPTKAELEELNSKCSWSWTGSGYKVTGPNGNSIFLPAAGFRDGTSYRVGSNSIWSSTLSESSTYNAWRLYFNSGNHDVSNGGRYYGFTVRPVCDK